jgi:hypothetical protein
VAEGNEAQSREKLNGLLNTSKWPSGADEFMDWLNFVFKLPSFNEEMSLAY